jgi:hypothetical protein
MNFRTWIFDPGAAVLPDPESSWPRLFDQMGQVLVGASDQ